MLDVLARGPVLAFPRGAAPEIVDDGRTGFLCDDERMMTSAQTRFSASRMVAEHLELYEQVMLRADGEHAA